MSQPDRIEITPQGIPLVQELEDFLKFNDEIKKGFLTDEERSAGVSADVVGQTGKMVDESAQLFERNPYFTTPIYDAEPEDPYSFLYDSEVKPAASVSAPSLRDIPSLSDMWSRPLLKPSTPHVSNYPLGSRTMDELVSNFAPPSPSILTLAPPKLPMPVYANWSAPSVAALPPPVVPHANLAPAAPLTEAEKHTNLVEARNKVAELSVQLRGKTSKSRNQILKAEYELVLSEYKLAYNQVHDNAAADLMTVGHDDDFVTSMFAFANAEEHQKFTKAESDAYDLLNPKLGKIAKGWAKMGFMSRTVTSVTGGGIFGAVATTVLATGAVLTGAGAIGVGLATLSVKAAKSIGMYRLNKASRAYKGFDVKASQDEQAASSVDTFRTSINNISGSASDALMSAIRNRAETDLKQNRKNAIKSFGSIVVGAVIGNWVHNLDIGGKGSGSPSVLESHGAPTGNSVVPSAEQVPTVTTVIPQDTLPTPSTQPEIIPQPTVPSTVPETLPGAPAPTVPTETTVEPGPVTPQTPSVPEFPTEEEPYVPGVPVEEVPAPKPQTPSLPDNPPTPVIPEIPADPIAETPTSTTPIQTVPHANIHQSPWSLAHEYGPGQENELMQMGIDKFNLHNDTNFALTPRPNGDTWIMDNGYAVSPSQRDAINMYMLQALQESEDETLELSMVGI